jgi:hypothetical protein
MPGVRWLHIMKVPKAKSWARLVVPYWLVTAAVLTLEIRYMEADWAGLPGFLLTLPLSAIVVAAGLLPAIAGRFGYPMPYDMNDYQLEYGFMVCAFLNAFILYPFYLLWQRGRARHVFDEPPPPNKRMHATADTRDVIHQ